MFKTQPKPEEMSLDELRVTLDEIEAICGSTDTADTTYALLYALKDTVTQGSYDQETITKLTGIDQSACAALEALDGTEEEASHEEVSRKKILLKAIKLTAAIALAITTLSVLTLKIRNAVRARKHADAKSEVAPKTADAPAPEAPKPETHPRPEPSKTPAGHEVVIPRVTISPLDATAKEMIVDIRSLGDSLRDAVGILKELAEINITSSPYGGRPGGTKAMQMRYMKGVDRFNRLASHIAEADRQIRAKTRTIRKGCTAIDEGIRAYLSSQTEDLVMTMAKEAQSLAIEIRGEVGVAEFTFNRNPQSRYKREAFDPDIAGAFHRLVSTMINSADSVKHSTDSLKTLIRER